MCFYLFRCIAKPQPVVTNLPFKIALIKIESLHKIKKNRFAGNLLNTIRVYLIKLYIIYRITTTLYISIGAAFEGLRMLRRLLAALPNWLLGVTHDTRHSS